MRSQAATPPEKSRYLVLMALGPAVWMLHFLVSYVTVSVWCARYSSIGGSLGPVQSWIFGYTIVALAAIALSAWGGHHRHTFEAGEPPHDADTPEDRHRFLGFATMLLAGLSAVATLYSAMAVFTFESC
jgi:hypothetical protein